MFSVIEFFLQINSCEQIILFQSIYSTGDRSYIVSEPVAEEIHAENINKLSSMSEDEILKARQELLQVLNPSHVEFLKQKRAETNSLNTGLESSIGDLTINKLVFHFFSQIL